MNKITLNESARGGPALAFDELQQLYLAWTGQDNQLHIMSASDPPNLNFANKVTFGEFSLTSPSLAYFKGAMNLAWTGTDEFRQLNILAGLKDKRILGEDSVHGPALAAFGDRLYMGWTGTDEFLQLNIMSSADGLTFGNKRILGQDSIASPGLSASPPGWLAQSLLMTWTGTDSNHSPNLWSAADGQAFGNKITLNEASIDTPAIATLWRIFIAWTGTDHHVNFAFSPSYSHGTTINETSASAPAIAVGFGDRGFGAEEQAYIAWTGEDGSSSINVMSFFPNDF